VSRTKKRGKGGKKAKNLDTTKECPLKEKEGKGTETGKGEVVRGKKGCSKRR